MQIKIKNWDKYNPRKELKSLTWIRLDADIGFSESLFGLSVEAKWLWVFLLSYSAKKNSGDFSIDESYLSHHSGVPLGNISVCLVALENNDLISKCSRIRPNPPASDTNPNQNVPYERTNETDVTNETQRPSVSENFKRINPDEVRNLFDEMLGGKGRIKKVPGHNFPSNLRTDFLNITGNAEFNDLAKWREYFDLVLKSDWLLNKFNTTFSWLLNPDNAFKVFSGQYENRDDPQKSASEANAKADALFETIVRKGRYEFKRADYSELEMKVLEGIGGLAVIFDCTDLTKKTVIANLRTEYRKAMEAV